MGAGWCPCVWVGPRRGGALFDGSMSGNIPVVFFCASGSRFTRTSRVETDLLFRCVSIDNILSFVMPRIANLLEILSADMDVDRESQVWFRTAFLLLLLLISLILYVFFSSARQAYDILSSVGNGQLYRNCAC